MEQTQQPKPRTATQRLEDVENAIMSLYQTADNMARDLMTIKEAIKLLGNKTDAIVKASANKEDISDDVISRIMVENNVEELKRKVDDLVAQGMLHKEDVVSEKAFVVGREIDESGTVVNPRLQFTLTAVQEHLRNKIAGTKVGETLELEEGKLKFEILESYLIQAPTIAAPEEGVAKVADTAEATEATQPANN